MGLTEMKYFSYNLAFSECDTNFLFFLFFVFLFVCFSDLTHSSLQRLPRWIVSTIHHSEWSVPLLHILFPRQDGRKVSVLSNRDPGD